MIIYRTGDIFTSTAQTLVNPVNCVGVMGKGLAHEFKQCYPRMFLRYRDTCRQGLFQPGMLWLYKVTSQRWILNFPTKRHWRELSRLAYIQRGLVKFLATYQAKSISSAAFPMLGTGLGGLPPETVSDLMAEKLSRCNIPHRNLEIHLN